MTWKAMRRNAWKGFASWQTKRRSSSTKSPLLVLATTKKELALVGDLS